MATKNKYDNAKIYRLVNNVDDEFYVGSTCDALHKRFYKHKAKAKHDPRPVHKHFNEIGWDNIKIILIEEYACKNKMELERRERYWIEELKPTLNKCIPTRTPKEWREQNKELILEKKKAYYEQNKEYFAKKSKDYNEQNKDKITEYTKEYYEQNKDQIKKKVKEYRKQNKQKYVEYGKVYREQNKEQIAQKKKEYSSMRVQCPHCNHEMNRGSLRKHIKTQHPS